MVEPHVGVGDKEGFAVADQASAHEMSHAAHPDNADLFVYDGAVVYIRPGADRNHVSVMRGGDCRSDGFELLSSTNGEIGGEGHGRGTAHRQSGDSSDCTKKPCAHDAT